MKNKWYDNSHRRYILDMHIPEWKDDFLSEFDSNNYIEMLKTANVDTAIICSTNCLGYSFYPTKIGHMHHGLRGRDIVKEIVALCRKENIIPIIDINYWSTIACREHPDWSCISPDGKSPLEFMYNTPGHFGVCCPNSPYGDYFISVVEEICNNYDCNGLWIDMILWHTLCTCKHCRDRYKRETGKEIPAVMNWEDKDWILYIRTREKWMAEYFQSVVDAAKAIKPELTVVSNATNYGKNLLGASTDYYRINDYIAGDFPPDKTEHSMMCKLFNSLVKDKPFECLVPVMNPELNEHSIMKSREMLLVELFSCIMNNGRYGFIDAVNPLGSINRKVYERMSELYAVEKRYEKYLESNVCFCADVAIYTNTISVMNPADNGKKMTDSMLEAPHIAALRGATNNLMEQHIPFAIITECDLDNLDGYKMIVLPDLCAVSEKEVKAFTAYVEKGGNLYISGAAGMYDGFGGKYEGGAFKELSGVTYMSVTEETVTYIRPEGEAMGILKDYPAEQPLTINSKQMIAKTDRNTEVLGRITLPIYYKDDNTKFSSAISNPPQINTMYPSIAVKHSGNGRVIYLACAVEKYTNDDRAVLFKDALSWAEEKGLSFYTDAPRCVEITAYYQPNKNIHIINLLNRQVQLPNIPVFGTKVKFFVGENIPKKLLHAPDDDVVNFSLNNGYIEFTVDRLDIFEMYVLEY